MSTFDLQFQEKVAAFYLRDDSFIAQAGSLVQPDFFTSEPLAAIIAVAGMYLEKYNSPPALPTFVRVFGEAVAKKKVKVADMAEVKRLLGVIYRDPLQNGAYIRDEVVEFARHQAIENATMELADALDSGDAAKIEQGLRGVAAAKDVGANDTAKSVDFKRTVADRALFRAHRAAGLYTNGGITTGNTELDSQLTPHRGFGRKEITILMGPPKSGKTAAMISFALAAATAGHKVFYASCEVSDAIIGDRSDANISGVPLKELEQREPQVQAALDAWAADPKTGEFIVEAFPIRTLKVSDLRRILARYKAQGIEFDMVVVDYGDIMRPETQYNDKRHGLAEIYQDLRAVSTEYNLAMLTATQTNREGTKKAGRNVTDGTDAADDYEKVRTADALITINASEDDKANGQVVLYFSEMRNATSGLKMRFNQDLSCMRFIVDFEGYD